MLNESATVTEVSAYLLTAEPWGGATINISTGLLYDGPTDAYACAVGTTIEIPEDADFATFQGAFENALYQNLGTTTYLGIFHDDDKHTIDFDGVEIVSTTAEVDALHRIRPVRGGAYHFATGKGYNPKSLDFLKPLTRGFRWTYERGNHANYHRP